MPNFILRLALPLCLAATLAPGARVASGDGGIEYEVVDGAVLVFGYRLETLNPLPRVGDCEGCGEIGFYPSPDGRWVLIVSDVRFTDNDIWLYDTASGARPERVVDARGGRHLATEWHSEQVFEVRWSGMGYSSSLLFDVAHSGDGVALANLLGYDAARDVYMRFHHDAEGAAGMVETGPVFSPSGAVERFPIALDNEYLADWMDRIETVEIDDAHLLVIYKTKARGLVTDRFAPKILEGAR